MVEASSDGEGEVGAVSDRFRRAGGGGVVGEARLVHSPEGRVVAVETVLHAEILPRLRFELLSIDKTDRLDIVGCVDSQGILDAPRPRIQHGRATQTFEELQGAP